MAVIVGLVVAYSPLTQLGGLSSVKRAVLTAQKAGVATCCIVTAADQEELRHELQNDPRVTSRVVWDTRFRVMPAIEQESSCLVFAADTHLSPPLAQQIYQQATFRQNRRRHGCGWGSWLALTAVLFVPQICTELAQGKSLPENYLLARSEKVQTGAAPSHFWSVVSLEIPI